MMTLLEMLTYRRPAGSASETTFINRYIRPHKPIVMAQNQVIIVPGDSDTLFSCHTDTVHKDQGKQIVLHDTVLELAYKDDKDPLGADNGAGVWLLLEMIKAKVPGTYAFHWGEERGCIGSKDMAEKYEPWLRKFKRAIAFDRRGTGSIITHQMGDRCCSDEFGLALAHALGGDYKLDDTGAYTDTASYTRLIPECTNVSVGYDHEHGPDETLDLAHVVWLRNAVLQVPWGDLPTQRDPSVIDAWWEDHGGARLFNGNDMDSTDIDVLIEDAGEQIRDYREAVAMVNDDPEWAAQMLYAFVLNKFEYAS